MSKLDELCINSIRFLAVDAIQKANSGHPGAPLGMAPMAYVLWDRFLKHNPKDPQWPDRDRFILSAGHASAMLYALLHLTGYDISLDEVKQFRQWGSKTPGHPEYGIAPGVEATTGPLGQGFANGVGMAIAQSVLAEHYNRPGYELFDHYIYAIISDGDLEEGITAEAASMAGTFKLGRLVYLYDDNDISIEGNTDITFKEDVGKRFRSYGWQVLGPVDGNDIDAIENAIKKARSEIDQPSIIICKTTIGFGSPNKAGTAGVHGEPLGEEEVRLTKGNLEWPSSEPFFVPDEALQNLREAQKRGKSQQEEWESKLEEYGKEHPQEAERLAIELKGDLPSGWDQSLDDMFAGQEKPVATRVAAGQVLNSLSSNLHALIGGSADLSPSTKTIMKDRGDFGEDNHAGHNMHFGIREHAMGAIANGMALHGGVIPYAATFLVFYDYMRAPVRLAAFMGLRVVFVFTHDSVGVGEDGPTHQPIEHLIGLRSVPNLVTIRPGDATEAAEAWRIALERNNGPTAMALSRQNLPIFDRQKLAHANGVRRGGYVLWEASASPDVIIIGTGSEVHIALEAGKMLQEKGIGARVVSMPSWELFEAQSEEYRREVLPANITRRISIEAGSQLGWDRYVGSEGVIIGMDRFGASAPQKVVYEKFGFTTQHIVDEAQKLFGKSEA